MPGIKELQEAVAVGVKFYKAYDLADDDGKIGWTDLQYLLDPIMSIPAAVQGAGEIKAEIADLDANELAQIKAYVRAEIGDDSLADDIVELIIVTGLNVAALFLKVKAAPTP